MYSVVSAGTASLISLATLLAAAFEKPPHFFFVSANCAKCAMLGKWVGFSIFMRVLTYNDSLIDWL